MRIIRDTLFLDPNDRGAAAAIGNFDGVHLGHQAVIDLTRKAAFDLGAPLGVMTFEPHPRQFFAPDAPPFRLMNAEAKAHRLRKLGVQKLYDVPFNAALAQFTPREFAETIIVQRLGLVHVVVGADFCFGAKRAGDVETLKSLGEDLGFGVTVTPLLTFEEEVSSTNIRNALSDGRPRDAARMLGHWHRIEGPVIRGDQRGRDLGYPTANMSITNLHQPKLGVYAVKVDVLEGPHAGSYDGAASIGVRPMFGEDNVPNIETFLFDFKGDLYGTPLSVALVDYLRPELKFDSLDALIVQMANDCDTARKILKDV
ncbi:bifunctional riboflavin kinase/FAD synthetase [Marivivens sp. JLT3646]|uniref:bifunctional riboflavin kinase/FAD synthetase n=1 Tax=Marivivens sp. JLT3646 TaxID=1920883 RepID=UPI0007FD5CD5|nr:bifunctional riboflavin kinase/FAD synthetase [Marivivens sp. JLT3646]APO87444.1 riboflavin biosynthesis protein RibF [Marivivens sp. JLT3646]OBR35953.1 riboflavin biosynthesis protein RibF [Donghicola sp. JL3646]